MRIGGVSDYNIAAQALRLQPGRAEAAQRTQENKSAESAVSRSQGPASQYIPENGGGVIQTRVSPENSFQKARLDNPKSSFESMADKLMSKLPDILRDMRDVPAYAGEDFSSGSARVVVSDRNAAEVARQNAQKAAEPLADFSL